MTIPDAVRALYTINARELDIDRLLWEKPFRVTMLELLVRRVLLHHGEEVPSDLLLIGKLDAELLRELPQVGHSADRHDVVEIDADPH